MRFFVFCFLFFSQIFFLSLGETLSAMTELNDPFSDEGSTKTNPSLSLQLSFLGNKDWKDKKKESPSHHSQVHDHTPEDHMSGSHEGHGGGAYGYTSSNGFFLQMIHVMLSADIGSHLKGMAVLPYDSSMNPHEAYVETNFSSLPKLRAGKFLASLGYYNRLHPHHFIFIDNSLMNEFLFGAHGFGGVGVSLSSSFPLPWKSELIAETFSSNKSSSLFSESARHLTGLVSSRNTWTWDSLYFGVQLSYMGGKNHREALTQILNGSLVLSWRPSASRSLTWILEYMKSNEKKAPEDAKKGGVGSSVQWQFNKHWFLQAREEFLGLPKLKNGSVQKHSFLLGVFPVTHASLRLQYDWVEKEKEREHRIGLQLNVSLGTHASHHFLSSSSSSHHHRNH